MVSAVANLVSDIRETRVKFEADIKAYLYGWLPVPGGYQRRDELDRQGLFDSYWCALTNKNIDIIKMAALQAYAAAA